MTALATPRHRVSVATAQMRAAADAVVDASVWSMDAAETAATLVELARHEAEVAELKARVAAHADDLRVGQDVGASSAANWLAHETKLTRPAAHGAVKLGHDLERHPLTRDALAGGEVCVDQARTIIRWVEALPDEVDADLRVRAEAHLLEQAQHHDARALNHLGKHLFEVIAPDEADAREAALLETEEAAAWARTFFTGADDGHGMGRGEYALPIAYFAALKKILLATMARKHRAATEGAGVEPRPTPEAMGHALCELIVRYPVNKLPKTGGLNATMLVLIDEDSLMGRVEKAGILDTGEKISPGMARRLACEAGIIPIVLGGDSQPLDVGKERRFHSKSQRYAILARDRGCRAEGCDTTTGVRHLVVRVVGQLWCQWQRAMPSLTLREHSERDLAPTPKAWLRCPPWSATTTSAPRCAQLATRMPRTSSCTSFSVLSVRRARSPRRSRSWSATRTATSHNSTMTTWPLNSAMFFGTRQC